MIFCWEYWGEICIGKIPAVLSVQDSACGQDTRCGDSCRMNEDSKDEHVCSTRDCMRW